ncbi:MAG: DUF4270 domain-containing protein [Bacteroidaceae bacterium]|nr:DUF4270 domain-containing protein [Bacteroidaceae bacterium]
MRIRLFKALCLLAVSAVFLACTEDGNKIGIIYDNEKISSDYAQFGATTCSQLMGAVGNSGTDCYLGRIVDPETRGIVTASFASQFHIFEDFRFPRRSEMFPPDGKDHSSEAVRCDSIELRIFFEETVGEDTNPMKLEVFELDKNKIIREDTTYMSDTQLMQSFVASGASPLTSKTFTPIDYSQSDSALINMKTRNIRVVLPRAYGDGIIDAYYKDPTSYKDSYTFIRRVCPGLYFRIQSGSGTMITVSVVTLNIFFSTYDTAGKKTSQHCRFATTPEVTQCTQIENSDMSPLVRDDVPYTYLKTPAGICTEVTLPIDAIFEGHATDSVSHVSIAFTRYNNLSVNDITMGTPATLLMVRKSEADAFFLQHKVTDNLTSYISSYSSAYGNYTFSNICQLVNTCMRDKLEGKADADWNKVLLIPVKTSTTQDSYGNTRVTKVAHDLGLNSIRLVKGTPSNPISVQVIYSQFQ